jgi:hypothetical protein
MRPIVHDPEALYAARFSIREAYVAIRKLRQADPSIRETLTRLDELCCELTLELESIAPELPMRVGGGMAHL